MQDSEEEQTENISQEELNQRTLKKINENHASVQWFYVSDVAVNSCEYFEYTDGKVSSYNNEGDRLFYFEKIYENKDDNQILIQGIVEGENREQRYQKFEQSKKNNRFKAIYKNVWCRELINIAFLRDVDENKHSKEVLAKKEKEIKEIQFLKISSDREIEYGDGGNVKLIKPLYFNKFLDIEKEKRAQFKDLLNKLAEERNDWNETCPVLDIIDPELCPHYNDNFKVQTKNVNNWSDEDYQNEREKNADKQFLKNEFYSLRSLYQWIPTKILVRKDMKCRISGPIHNLEYDSNQELYGLFEHTFEKMLEGFKNIDLFDFSNSNVNELQVIIKAQKYVLQPNMTYSGKWHLEGKTEHIKAAGVYYLSIDEGFGHDQLHFKPLVCYQEDFIPNQKNLSQWKVDVQDGCALTFQNTLPHKFDLLKNETDKPLERLFVNFFIVDPQQKLKDANYFQQIMSYLKIGSQQKLSQNLIGYVMEFLGYSQNIDAGKKKRKQVREQSGQEVSGWGFIHYGNCGDVQFIDGFQQAKVTSEFDDFEQI